MCHPVRYPAPMKHRYRPTFAGIVILALALYIALCSVRWGLAGHAGDAAGATVGAVIMGVLAWRLDSRPVL